MDEPKHAGRPTLFAQYLAKNPDLKRAIDAAKTATDAQALEFTDIASIEDLIEYACFELTRSKNENLLRGRTFTEYARAFTGLFEAKDKLRIAREEWDMKKQLALRDRTEIDAFMKIIYEAIANKIDDISLKKAISDEIQRLYDVHHPNERPDTDPKPESDKPAAPTDK